MATVVPGEWAQMRQGPGSLAAADRDVDHEAAIGVRLDPRQLDDVDIESRSTS